MSEEHLNSVRKPKRRRGTRRERIMAMSRNWFGILRRKFLKPSHKTIIVLHTNTTSNTSLNEEITAGEREEAATFEEGNGAVLPPFQSSEKKQLSKEDIAAIKIQTTFRGHLARRAYRALRSLVKLQALVRGVCVRKQTRIALHCMHALVRLQVGVHARHLLSKCSEDN